MEPNSKKNLFLCSRNLQINVFLQPEKNLTFQQNFTCLRKKLQIKLTRKTYIDSILKKCKGRFFKAINDCLRKCTFIYIHKLPQRFITDISIDYNKSFFNYTTIDLYRYFNLKPFNKDEIENSNFCIKGKENYLKFILSSKLSDLYSIFIESKRYKREVESIKNNSGVKMSLLYQFVSENYYNYYLFSKPRMNRKKKQKLENDIESKINNKNNIIMNETKNSTIASINLEDKTINNFNNNVGTNSINSNNNSETISININKNDNFQ